MPHSETDRARIHHGRLTIPAPVRQAAHLPEEGTLLVQPMGNGVFLVAEENASPALLAMLEFRRTADEAGMTLQDLLNGLDDEGTRYTQEMYGG